MTSLPRRAWLQVHLSTAVWLMFVAGLLLWANIEPVPSPWDDGTRCGWPFTAYVSSASVGPGSPSREDGLNWLSAAGDLAIAFAFLAASAAVLEWFTRAEKKPWLAVCCATAAGAAPSIMVLYGYGSWLRSGFWIFLLPIALAFASWALAAFYALLALGRPTQPGFAPLVAQAGYSVTRFYAAMLVVLVFFGAWFGAAHIRKEYCSHICRKAEPVVAALQEFRAEHGSYPEHLEDIPNWAALATQTGLNIHAVRPGHANLLDEADADVTVFLHPQRGCALVVAIERTPMMSFTRYYMYVWSTDEPHWREVCFHWILTAMH